MRDRDNSPDVGRRMMAFNWLPAAYAHADWLSDWAEALGSRGAMSLRVLQRASIALLNRYDLRVRFLREVGPHGWLMHSHGEVCATANVLGTAMLGGWVHGRLERHAVAAQQAVLGTQGRSEALRHAHSLRALPFAPSAAGWPVVADSPAAVVRLGISCLAALLDDPTDGARERFTLRFAHGTVVALDLSAAQRAEALTLIAEAEAQTEIQTLTPTPTPTQTQTRTQTLSKRDGVTFARTQGSAR